MCVCREAAGTNLGNIREQPPTGKRVEFAGISLLTFNEDGQIETTMVFRCVLHTKRPTCAA
jgi:predicted ester cyclase